MVSSAELGTITIDPFSFKPSNSIFIPLRCNATGLSVYFLLACSNFSAISVSAVPKMTRALLSRSAWASLLIASARSCGIAISLIPTVWHVMPHGFVFLSKTCCKSSAILSRSCKRSDSSCLPMVSLKPVCVICSIAFDIPVLPMQLFPRPRRSNIRLHPHLPEPYLWSEFVRP